MTHPQTPPPLKFWPLKFWIDEINTALFADEELEEDEAPDSLTPRGRKKVGEVLQRLIDAERAARVEAERQRDEAVSALAREREARAQMKGWFRVYGEHAPFCATNGRINVACDCGYEYAEEKVNKLAALPAPAKGAAE